MKAAIDCPSGYVCIYPEINFGGQPWVRRAVDGSVKDLPTAIRDRGSSIRNNSDRTARVYEKRNHSGRHVCVTRSGGSLHDLRGYNLNDQTRSLKINRNDCGCPSPTPPSRRPIRTQQSAPPGKHHRAGLISARS
ncbi:peptidase inhibitor family I36 protein [Streptomyces coeruleorubidus]|uniref:peptidase inhibitor family I36 protein n=1 Tax=Streptomyces coeruleorubidus TaxID=116188 RepID=UPI0036FB47D2